MLTLLVFLFGFIGGASNALAKAMTVFLIIDGVALAVTYIVFIVICCGDRKGFELITSIFLLLLSAVVCFFALRGLYLHVTNQEYRSFLIDWRAFDVLYGLLLCIGPSLWSAKIVTFDDPNVCSNLLLGVGGVLTYLFFLR